MTPPGAQKIFKAGNPRGAAQHGKDLLETPSGILMPGDILQESANMAATYQQMPMYIQSSPMYVPCGWEWRQAEHLTSEGLQTAARAEECSELKKELCGVSKETCSTAEGDSSDADDGKASEGNSGSAVDSNTPPSEAADAEQTGNRARLGSCPHMPTSMQEMLTMNQGFVWYYRAEPKHETVSEPAEETGVLGDRSSAEFSGLTLSLCNIPCYISRGTLTKALKEHGFAGTYDFLYLPCRYGKRGSKKAIINFTSVDAANRFVIAFENFRFCGKQARDQSCVVEAAREHIDV